MAPKTYGMTYYNTVTSPPEVSASATVVQGCWPEGYVVHTKH